MSELTLAEIKGLPAEILATKDSQKIADFLPPRISIKSTQIGVGTILAVMAPAGGAFLDALENIAAIDSDVKWSFVLIKAGTFDIGMAETRQQLLVFVSKNPSLSGPISALLKVAEVKSPVDEMDVRKLVWSDTGEWLA